MSEEIKQTPIRKLEKTVSATAIIVKESTSGDIEIPNSLIYFASEITWSILDKEDQNTWLIKSNQPIFEAESLANLSTLVLKTNFAKVFLWQKGVTVEIPASQAYESVKVSRTRAKRIKSESVDALVKSGNCIGIFRSLNFDTKIII